MVISLVTSLGCIVLWSEVHCNHGAGEQLLKAQEPTISMALKQSGPRFWTLQQLAGTRRFMQARAGQGQFSEGQNRASAMAQEPRNKFESNAEAAKTEPVEPSSAKRWLRKLITGEETTRIRDYFQQYTSLNDEMFAKNSSSFISVEGHQNESWENTMACVSNPQHEEFAALCGCVYTEDMDGALLPNLQVRGWRQFGIFENNDTNLRVAIFTCKKDMVVAVRGTMLASAENMQDNAKLALNTVPDLVAQLYTYIRALDQNGAFDGFQVHFTGHSLGAAAVNIVLLQLAQMDRSWIEKITSAVLFENPGVPSELINASKVELKDRYGDVSSKVTEYFGAPNFINMASCHMGGQQIWVKLPHHQPLTPGFVARCTWGSLNRALSIVSLVSWAKSGIAALAKAEKAASSAARLARAGKAARAAKAAVVDPELALTLYSQAIQRVSQSPPSVAAILRTIAKARKAGKASAKLALTLRPQQMLMKAVDAVQTVQAVETAQTEVSLATQALQAAASAAQGISESVATLTAISTALASFYAVVDIGCWTCYQHDLETMRRALKVDSNLVRVKGWPDRVALQALLRQFVVSLVPFHPANEGLHTVQDRDALVEARVQMLLKCVEEK